MNSSTGIHSVSQDQARLNRLHGCLSLDRVWGIHVERRVGIFIPGIHSGDAKLAIQRNPCNVIADDFAERGRRRSHRRSWQ